jgi:aspartate racemase
MQTIRIGGTLNLAAELKFYTASANRNGGLTVRSEGGSSVKTIGLIGGMSWESSIEYYRIINEVVHKKLGGLHSAISIMYSLDFAEIETLQHQGRWEEATQLMVEAARHVENGGADFVVICTNTMHRMANEVQEQIGIPLLHIADATAEKIKAQGLGKVGLLGTRFTMEEDFYRGRLIERHGLQVIIPGEKEREIVHRVIYDELVVGDIRPSSKAQYIEIIGGLVAGGAEGIILGCTEIGLLVGQEDIEVPVFDTTLIHATAAAEYALGDYDRRGEIKGHSS